MEVELPNGQIAEFPDDMPHEQIESALRSHFGPKKATEGDKSNAFEMIKKKHPGMPDFLIHALMPTATKMAEQPEDTSRGTGAGAFLRSAVRAPLEGAENLASLLHFPTNKNAQWPSAISESESDKSHPFAQLGGELAGFLPLGGGSLSALRTIPALGKMAEKASGSFLRKLPLYGAEGAALGAGYSPEGHREEGALTGLGLGAAGAAIPSIGKGLGALKERFGSLRNLDRLKSEGKISESDYQKSISEEKSLKELMKHEGIETSKSKLGAELPELKIKSQELAAKIKSIPEVNTSNMLGTPEGENLVPQAESLLKKSEQKAAEAEKSIGNHLGEGNAHDVRSSKIAKKMIEDKKTDIGSIFENVKNELKETHVELPRGRDVKEITNDLYKSIKEGGYGSNEVQKLSEELDKANKAGKDIIPGDNFLAMYRSTRSLANKAMRNSRKTDIDALDRIHWEKQYKTLTDTAEKMNKLLESHMSKDSYASLQRANHRWKTEITPLYKNKLYWQITKEGRLPSDIIKQVRGTGEGQEILRSMIKSNPELLKNVVGQRYASNPSKLHEFDELSHEFIKEMPELQNLMKQHKEALSIKKTNEQNLVNAKNKASKLKSESERVNKSFEETKKTQEARKKSVEELKLLKEKIHKIERYIPELKKKSKAKELSLKNKMEIESKISKAEKDVESLKRKAFQLAAGIGVTTLGALGLRKIAN